MTELDHEREVLHSMLDSGASTDEVLMQSQKLDELINHYNKKYLTVTE